MSVIVLQDQIKFVRLSVPLEQFPHFIKQHVESDALTFDIERWSADYVAHDFPMAQTKLFLQKVCKWGHYPGVAARVWKRNDHPDIRARLREARRALLADDPHEAISQVAALRGLGVSFGSKHLRFLDPDRAVVLDSTISERLGYPRTVDGYVEFLADCFKIGRILNDASIAASEQRARWRVCDVEMAIYKSLKDR